MLTFMINLELYSGVGREFYECGAVEDRKRLISTGLWTTLMAGVIVILLALFFSDSLYQMFFKGDNSYRNAYLLIFIWAPISSIQTYLSVMMRYEQKPKLYFLITNITLVTRLSATILCVVVLRLGVKGVILGNIIGEAISLIMLSIALKQYFVLNYDLFQLKKALKFSLPLVPGILIISANRPLTRYLVVHYLTISDMGLFTVASQLAAILTFISYGLRISWLPHLYELIKRENYQKEIKKIYDFFLNISTVVGLLIVLNGKLLLNVLTTEAFYPAFAILGFVVFQNVLEITRNISGCGMLVAKKTYFDPILELSATVASVVIFVVFHKIIGIAGLAVALWMSTLVKYIGTWLVTVKYTPIRLNVTKSIVHYSIFFSISLYSLIKGIKPTLGIILSVVVALYFFISNKERFYSYTKLSIGKVSSILGERSV
jgi:O-antigen/teichoic acid export membrane protein